MNRDFPDYIPYKRDAYKVAVTFPKLKVSVTGIAVMLAPAPSKWMVYVYEDWMPAIFWRKRAVGNDKRDFQYTRFVADASYIKFLDPLLFSCDEWGIYHYRDREGVGVAPELFYSVGWHEEPTCKADSTTRTIRAWTLAGWYVKNDALPVGYAHWYDEEPPLFDYKDCIPLQGKNATDKRMRTLTEWRWKHWAEMAGFLFKQNNPNASSDDIEMAASEYCENFIYRDWLGQRIQPTQKATTFLYSIFCGAAGVLV